MMTCVYTVLPVIEATILMDPYKGSHVLRWSKSRGTTDSTRLGLSTSREASFTISNDDDDVTPYRLPRISPNRGDVTPSDIEFIDGTQERKQSVESDKVWSRYGYEKIIRVPQLGPQIKVLLPPSHHILQQYRQATTVGGPKFKNAAITPSIKSLPWNLGRDIDDIQTVRSNRDILPNIWSDNCLDGFCESCQRRIKAKIPNSMLDFSHSRLGKSRDNDDSSGKSPRLEPTPTPISRSESPAKSVRSIHWILGHNRYHTFDKKGRSHIQGPFSREFNVTCMPPNNWLKMKLGRSKTMVN